MRWKALFCLCFLLVLVSAGAVVTEDSASANALSGITLLSCSVSDFALSPTIPATGIAFSCNLPFYLTDCAVYSLNAASGLGPCIFSSGAGFLGNSDYRWQDYHLGLAFHYQELSLGASGHLIYEKFSTGDSYHDWTGDFALSYRGEDYGSEIKYLHAGLEDAELHVSVSSLIVPGVTGASTYVYVPHGKDNYRCATTMEIGDLFELQSSWQSDPARFGAGVQFRLGSFSVMYGIRTHPELSLSHSLDFGIQW